MVVSIVHENVMRRRIDGHSVYVAEVTGARIDGPARRSAECSPLHEELPVLIELRHACAGVAVRDEEGAVGQPIDIGRPVEVRCVRAGYLRSADGLQQLAAIVREAVDYLHVVVDDPDVLFRIVRADVDGVRTAEQLVPLLPGLDDLAVAIHHHHAVLPFRVHAQLAIGRTLDAEVGSLPFPSCQPLADVVVRSASARQRRHRCVAPESRYREADARPQLRQQRPPWEEPSWAVRHGTSI